MNNHSNTHNTINNIASVFIYQICAIFINIIVMQKFLRLYGSEVNGLVSMINQVLGYTVILEVGLSATAIQALYMPVVQRKKRVINSILSTTSHYFKKVGINYIACVFIIAVALPWIIPTRIPSGEVILLTLILSIPSMLDYMFQGRMRVLLVANQKIHIVNYFNSISLIFTAFARLALMREKEDFLVVQSMMVVFVIVKIFCMNVYIKKKYKWISFHGIENQSVLKQKKANLVHQIAGLVVNGTDIVIISLFLGLKYGSIYSVYSLVFSILSNLMWQLSNAITPTLAHLLLTQEELKFRKTFMDFTVLYYIFTFVVYGSSYLLILPFINLYTINIKDIDYFVRFLPELFAIIGVANALRIPSNGVINAAGHFQKTQNRAIIEALLNLSISLIALNMWGMCGVLVGTICSFAYRTCDIILYVNKNLIKNIVYKQSKLVVVDCMCIIPVMILFKSLVYKNIQNWSDFIVVGTIIVLIMCLWTVLWNCIFERECITMWKNYLLGLIKRRK